MLTQRRRLLTERETQVALLLAQGLSNRLIAAELDINDGTVTNYVRTLFRKFQLKNGNRRIQLGIQIRTLLASPICRGLLYSAQTGDLCSTGNTTSAPNEQRSAG